jgi:hypothetical protein
MGAQNVKKQYVHKQLSREEKNMLKNIYSTLILAGIDASDATCVISHFFKESKPATENIYKLQDKYNPGFNTDTPWLQDTTNPNSTRPNDNYLDGMRERLAYQFTVMGNHHWGSEIDIDIIARTLRINIIVESKKGQISCAYIISPYNHNYIILENANNVHYELKTYNNCKHFTFSTLPTIFKSHCKCKFKHLDVLKAPIRIKTKRNLKNQGGGNCLFHAISQGLLSCEKKWYGVQKLRNIVAKAILKKTTDEIWHMFQLLWSDRKDKEVGDKWPLTLLSPVQNINHERYKINISH